MPYCIYCDHASELTSYYSDSILRWLSRIFITVTTDEDPKVQHLPEAVTYAVMEADAERQTLAVMKSLKKDWIQQYFDNFNLSVNDLFLFKDHSTQRKAAIHSCISEIFVGRS